MSCQVAGLSWKILNLGLVERGVFWFFPLGAVKKEVLSVLKLKRKKGQVLDVISINFTGFIS
jgi:hypothetical protein